MRADRFTLAAITLAAVLGAFLTAVWIPAPYTPGPLLTWAVTYAATAAGLARACHLPVARTLVASALLVAAVLEALACAAYQGLGYLRRAGVALLNEPNPVEA